MEVDLNGGFVMTEPKKKHRYKHAEGKRWIEVRVKNPLQLFDARDPAPFRERDLDDDFVEYILASAREFSVATPLKIVIYVEEKEGRELSKDSIREAIHSYLSYRIEIEQGLLKAFLKRTQLYFVIGLIVLGACLGLAQSLTISAKPSLFAILREGLVIFGWVSLWKPIELMLFDWYPLWEKLSFYKKLLRTEIDLRFAAI